MLKFVGEEKWVKSVIYGDKNPVFKSCNRCVMDMGKACHGNCFCLVALLVAETTVAATSVKQAGN